MGREPDSYEDEGTWHQPLPEAPAGPPHNQPTAPGSDVPLYPAPAAPEKTNVERTSSEDDVSRILHSSSSDDQPSTDPHRTQHLPREGSSEWDLLPPPTLSTGQVVFDKYRLVEKIGEGGMGEVWRVWHVSLDADRALKLIKSELANNEKGWRRFQREARLMAKINHPNAVAVYDFRRTQSVAYIEMEFIRGRSLAEVIKAGRDQPMPVAWTAQVLDQLCAVLQEAHGHLDETTGEPKPIIHRDLKPSNLMLVERKDREGPPLLKVLDFGIAKIVEDDGSPELTGAGDLIGTPAYMSPEQIRGGFERDAGPQEIDGRSDLYSTGVVLYHLLTGALPFKGGKMALLGAHLSEPPMPMKEANPRAHVPPEVEKVVLRCLEKDPARRPQTARELADQFRKAAGIAFDPHVRGAGGGRRLRRTAMTAAAAVLIAGVGMGALFMAWGARKLPITEPPIGGSNAGGSVTKTGPEKPVAPRDSGLWEPEGYWAEDRTEIVPDHPNFPFHLKRRIDGALFVFVREGVYIPEGYEPESPNDTLGDWPRTIIRTGDQKRFIRIEGGVYRRGDPRSSVADRDNQNNPMTPHHVRVRNFYIQETEVTHGEILSFSKRYPNEPGLSRWQEWLSKFEADHPNSTNYPAVCIDYSVARKYALSVGGLLPTEAQWEWAAKSRHEKYLFAWGEQFAQGPGDRARLESADNNTDGPAQVTEYPSDVTLQKVRGMVGNVRELCADAYEPYAALKPAERTEKNPLVDDRKLVDLAAPKVKVVARGGSFHTGEDRAMAFFRWAVAPRDVPDDVGFRVVIECPGDAGETP
jgi:serine/threonine-protein kinase